MISKVAIALCLMIAVATAVPAAAPGWGSPVWGPAAWAPQAAGPWAPPAPGASPFVPQYVASAPWYPQWSACTTIGSTCLDCNTKQICTKIGGLTRACNDPTLPYCNAGECSATPTAECAPTIEAQAA